MVAAEKLSTPAAPSPLPTKYTIVDVDKVTPDPGQPRKTFDHAELVELAESVRVHGIIVPPEVREHPAKDGFYMLVAGERRWRAAKMVGLKEMPVLVVEISAELVLEHQLIENSQRVDVPPLEEAEAYDALMKKHGYTMDRLIQKTGRSKAHLYGRLKLLGLCDDAKKAMQAGKLAPAIAELVARIPDQKLQAQATKDVLGKAKDYSYELEPERIRDDGKNNYSPLSFRAALQLIRGRYQTQFDLQKFDPIDKELVPTVGSCTTCPHRAGNQPALPGLAPAKGLDDDYCTKPVCFEEKVEASFNEKAKQAQVRGLKVIDGTAAKKILPFNSGQIAGDANYADPKDQLPYNVARPGSNASFASLLGKKIAEVPSVFVQDPISGVGRELLVKDKAIEKLRELGKIDKAEKKSSSSSAADKKAKEERSKHLAKQRFNDDALVRALADVAERAAKDTEGKRLLPALRWIARGVIRDYATSGGDGGEVVLKRRGLEEYSYADLEDLVVKARSVGEILGILGELQLGIHSEAKLSDHYPKKDREFFDDGLKAFGVDWDKALAAAKEASKVEAKSDAAKDAKKAPAKKGKAK